jgi:hypothetical protein
LLRFENRFGPTAALSMFTKVSQGYRDEAGDVCHSRSSFPDNRRFYSHYDSI